MPIKEIARRLGLARNTVRAALRAEAPPSRERGPRGSAVDEVEPAIRALLAEFPRMPATVIAERIGWRRSLTILKDRVRELRPLFTPPDPTDRAVLARRGRPVRPVVPAGPDPRRWRGRAGLAGADDDLRVLTGHRRGDDPLAQGRGHLGRDVADPRQLGCLPAHPGLGPGVGDRRARQADGRGGQLRRDDRGAHQARSAAGSGVQGPGRAAQRVLRDVVPARSNVHRPVRLHRPDRPLAGRSERTRGCCERSVRSAQPSRGRPTERRWSPCRRWRRRSA